MLYLRQTKFDENHILTLYYYTDVMTYTLYNVKLKQNLHLFDLRTLYSDSLDRKLTARC